MNTNGSLAQLGERLPYKQDVTGSSPVTPTMIFAGVAQLAEQLICNQQVAGSSPITSSNMGEFPSGQRGQTVNLLLIASVVRIHPLPPSKPHYMRFFCCVNKYGIKNLFLEKIEIHDV